MAITQTTQKKDVVFIQRANDNSAYGEIHISGSLLIPYIDENGNITADTSASFYTKFPVSGSSGAGGLITASTYPITSSWAESASWAPPIASDYAVSASWSSESFWATSASYSSNSRWSISSSFSSQSISSSHAESASWAPAVPSDYSISSSWASESFWATSASFASKSISSSYFSGSQITASSILVNEILPLGSTIGSETQPFTSIYANNIIGTASWSTSASVSIESISASWSSESLFSTSSSFASNSLSASWAPPIASDYSISSSWSSQSLWSVSSSFSSMSISSSISDTASFLLGTIETASYSYTSSQSDTASYFNGIADTSSYAYTASVAISASWAPSTPSDYSISSSWSSESFWSTSASFASRSFSSNTSSWSSASLSSTSASFASRSISSSFATSASWAPGGAGASTFLGLTDTPSTYANSNNLYLRVNPTATAVTFDTASTGISIILSPTASTETNSSLTTTGGTYNRMSSRITTTANIYMLSMSVQVATAATYSAYFATDSGSFDNIETIFSSQSFALTNTFYSFSFNNPRFWLANETRYIVVEKIGAATNFRFRNGVWTATNFTSNNSVFSGSTVLMGAFSPAFELTYKSISGYNIFGEFPTTASYALSSSYALTSSQSETSSYSHVSQTTLPAVNTWLSYDSASFNPLTATTGSCILWILPESSSYHDDAGTVMTTQNGQLIRRLSDMSGLERNVYNQLGTTTGKISLLTNTGVSGSQFGICSANSSAQRFYSNTFSTITKPIWAFVVGKSTPRNHPTSASSACVFDGITSGTRMGVFIGSMPQLYCGASLTTTIDTSYNTQFSLQSFKNNGASSVIRTNRTESVAGNCGTQNMTGYNFGADYAGNGGAGIILEFLLYSNITDDEAMWIENYLMSKYGLPQ